MTRTSADPPGAAAVQVPVDAVLEHGPLVIEDMPLVPDPPVYASPLYRERE